MKPDWERYYRETSPIPLKEHQPEIIEVLTRLINQRPHNPPFTFALGGIHPNATSATDFVETCQRISPEPQNHHIIFDIHPQALMFCGSEVDTFTDDLTQIEHLPPNSVDFLILHFTLMFLNPDQLEAANQSLARTISNRGAILAFIEEKGLHNCFGLLNPNHVPTHYHQPQTLLDNLSLFKPTLICYCHPNTYLYTFTHQDSPYPTHTGDPIDFGCFHH